MSDKPNKRPLTRREVEILKLLSDDFNTNEIAARLGIQPKTIEYHRAEMKKGIGVKGIAGLVRYAILSGIIEP